LKAVVTSMMAERDMARRREASVEQSIATSQVGLMLPDDQVVGLSGSLILAKVAITCEDMSEYWFCEA